MGLCPDSVTPCICMSVRFMCSPLITLTSVWCRSCLILTLPHTFQSPKKKAVEQTINPPPPPSSLHMGLIYWLWIFSQSLEDRQSSLGGGRPSWFGLWKSHTVLRVSSVQPPAVRLRLIGERRGRVTDMFEW